MQEKQCFKCNNLMPIGEFYRHSMMADGHLNKCKHCTKKDVRNRENKLKANPEWVKSERIRAREKYYRLYRFQGGTNLNANKLWRKKYPEKAMALSLSQRQKPSSPGLHLHHWSYRREHAKDTIELHRNDHALLHRYLFYDQNEMMYRDGSGKLLCSKQSHLDLLGEIKKQLEVEGRFNDKYKVYI